MKRIVFILAAVLLLASCSKNASVGTEFSSVAEEFANPGKEYRPAPLWVWNTEMTEADIDFMLTEYSKQGFGGAFVHPRPGLETEYLSDRWFELWRYSVEKGKELGLDIWIYDENSYPSGFAGGNVPAEMPESYNQGNVLVGKVSEKAPSKDSCFMCLLREGDSFTDITESLDSYAGKAGKYYVYTKWHPGASAWTGGYPYVDLMVKGVTEKFIEITMKGYEKTFGDELGPVVKGTFTDEPNIHPGRYDGHCRWTPDLFATFEQMWGYDLRPNWPKLGEEIGDWKKVRHDYNATLLRLFIDRWAIPWHDWCAVHGMKWTGHYWEHSWPDLNGGPDNMAMYAWHQMPAIDMLFNQFDEKSPNAQFGNARSVKELRSVANQMGYRRTLSETYGGAGADVTFKDLKRLGDWEYVLGVNFMNQHLSHTTVTGVRKYDYPPEFTPISSWWDQYHVLNDYFSRLSLVLSEGEQLCDWLVMEPTTSLWLYSSAAMGSRDPLYRIADPFQALVTDLEKNMVEFDLGCEDMINDLADVTSDGFRIGERTYTTVVIPPMTENLEARTVELLREFAEKGGRVITMSRPSMTSGIPSEWDIPSLDVASAAELVKLAEPSLNYSEYEGLYHQHRTYRDGDLHFFVNSSLEKPARLSFSPKEEAKLYLLDAMTGKISAIPESSVSVTVPPAGSALYFITEDGMPSAEPAAAAAGTATEMKCGPLSITRTRPNVLNLDFCTLTVDGRQMNNLYVKEANRRMWEAFGLNDPWESAIQYRRSILDGDTLTNGNIIVEYRFNLSGDADFSSMRMIVERPDIWNVAMNGRPVVASEDTLLDRRCGLYDISRYVRKGSNCVTVQRDMMSIHAELAPVFILGDFDVLGVAKGWRIAPSDPLRLGDITLQGSPEYPWPVSYKKKFEISSKEGRYVLSLGKWNGTSAKVLVNGEPAGNISFPPYELDITDAVQQGGNTVDVQVAGTLRNLYGPHYSRPAGLTGPWSWNGVEKQISGREYSLMPTGLEEEYKIKNVR